MSLWCATERYREAIIIEATRMLTVVGDIETCSRCDLKECGSFIYSISPSTDVLCLCFAVDNGEIQVWKPGDPVPAPFINPAKDDGLIWFNWLFDAPIYANILVKRYGFAPIPIERQDCAQRLALANGYPAELDLCCEALDIPYRKDPEARKAMLRLARLPSTDAKKHKKPKPVDPAAQERDLVLLVARCKGDVAATRAVYNHSRLCSLIPHERQVLLLDAKINARGVCANIPFLEAARALAIKERNAVNVRLNELTAGVVTSVFQVKKIVETINARGHNMATLGKRSVSAVLAHKPEDFVREILRLRQRGAFASAQKIKKLLAFADAEDHRIRGVLRYHGAGTGRWSSLGAQLHNLPRNDSELPASLVEAVLVGDRAALAHFGDPLKILAGLMRAVICAAPGHKLISVDFAAIESRVLAWFANEPWKLDAFRAYDASGDERLHPYRRIAAQMQRKNIADITKAERQMGKSAELAFGFGGVVGAWQRIVDDGRSEAEIKAINRQWRSVHPQTRIFWNRLMSVARAAIRTRQAIRVNPAPAPSIIAAFDGYTLTLELPSGRLIVYPGARLVPNKKFADGDPDIEYLTNEKGKWCYTRAWYGVLVENVVSGTARDLLAAAMLRGDPRGWSIVHHAHDEMTVEVSIDAAVEQDVLAVMLEPLWWAANLPLGGKMHSGSIYFEGPATAKPPPPQDEEAIEHAVDTFVATAPSLPDTKEIERGTEDDFLASLENTIAPLTDLISLPMDASHRVSCPFHDDPNPSCSIYPDHYYCHACHARGDRLDWLMKVEDMTRAEALAALHDWEGPVTPESQHNSDEKLDYALSWWDAADPLAGSIGERYLAETRGINIIKLPISIHEALRFHPRCIFGPGEHHPCIVALMHDPVTNVPVGVHRIGLTPNAKKIDRRALGRMGVVKLWPMNGVGQLVVGEGIETVLAAATRIPYRGFPLTPAWSAVAKGGLGRLPVLLSVPRLILLVDNDANGEGQKAAARCQQVWTAAGRTVEPLIPKQVGWDFNDVVLGRKA
jgi:DNA polymerase